MLSSAKIQRALAALLLAGVLLMVPVGLYVKEFIDVDGCLDAGGVYNYSTGECDLAEHPYIRFSRRHPRTAWMIRFLAPVGAVLVVLALGGTIFVTTRPSN